MDSILKDIRVIELTDRYGGYAGKLLAEMGAEVILVEPPEGNPYRHMGPFYKDEPGLENSMVFNYVHACKKSVVLDLTGREGKDRLLQLVAGSDIVITSFPPGKLDQLCVGFEEMRKTNETLIYGSFTPFGETGPKKDWKSASSLIPMAMTGPMFECGSAGKEPLTFGGDVVDNGTSMYFVLAVMAALHRRRKQNVGGKIDVSMIECVALWRFGPGLYQAPPHKVMTRGDMSVPISPSGFYQCKDYRVYTIPGQNWAAQIEWMKEKSFDIRGFDAEPYMIKSFSNPHLLEKAEEVDQLLCDFAATMTAREYMEQAQAHGVPTGIVETDRSVCDNSHMNARGFIQTIDHPRFGTVRTLGAQAVFSASPLLPITPAPTLGANSREFFGEDGELR